MSRTYRHRHRIPKGFKTREKGQYIYVIDDEGVVIWEDDFTGLQESWSYYRPKYTHRSGWIYETTIWEIWKSAYFHKRKVPSYRKVIRTFCEGQRYYHKKDRRRRERKRVRRFEHIQLSKDNLELLSQQEGKFLCPAHARRRQVKSCEPVWK